MLDRWSEVFGFRRFEARKDGFYLNDRRIFLRGVCLWGELANRRRLQTDADLLRRYFIDLPPAANANARLRRPGPTAFLTQPGGAEARSGEGTHPERRREATDAQLAIVDREPQRADAPGPILELVCGPTAHVRVRPPCAQASGDSRAVARPCRDREKKYE